MRRSGRCCSCALRRRITVYGLHCRRCILHQIAVAGAAAGRRRVTAAERRALRVIVENKNGMIGEPGIFIPRQYRQHAEDELRAQEVFEIAMHRLGSDDRDAFFMRVVELVANTWLTRMRGRLSSSYCPNNVTSIWPNCRER